MESYMAVQPESGEFMIEHTSCGFRLLKELVGKIRSFEIAGLLIACVLILAEGSLGSSGEPGPQMAAHVDVLSVVVQPSDGTYEIQIGNGGHRVVHARVAAEIDHKWVKSTDYPKHEISQSTFEDALGHGNSIRVTSSQLAILISNDSPLSA
jgi:hypothetical protein